MQLKPSVLVVGLLAGIAGGLMALAGLAFGAVAVALMFAAPAAVYIAALGWGPVAGAVAAVVATAVAAYDSNMTGIVASATLWFLPAAWAGHLANLAQPSADGRSMDWYPLSAILMRMMLALGAGFVVTGIVAGYDAASVAELMARSMRELAGGSTAPQQVDAETIERSAQLYAGMLPLIMPAFWLLVHVLIFHAAATVTRQSGHLARPRDDIPATATLPAAALAMPIGGLAGMMTLSSPLYEVAAVIAGIGIAGFALIGLAELHFISRGKPSRGFVLFLTYLVLVLFSFPLLLFAVWGGLRAINRQSGSPPGRPNAGPPAPRD